MLQIPTFHPLLFMHMGVLVRILSLWQVACLQ